MSSNRFIDPPTLLGLLTKVGEHRFDGENIIIKQPEHAREFAAALKMVPGIADVISITLDWPKSEAAISLEMESGLTLQGLYLNDLLDAVPEPCAQSRERITEQMLNAPVSSMKEVANRAANRRWNPIAAGRALLDWQSEVTIKEGEPGFLHIDVDGVRFDTVQCKPGQSALIPFLPERSKLPTTSVPGVTVETIPWSRSLRVRREPESN